MHFFCSLFKIVYPLLIIAAFGDICLAAANNSLLEAVIFLIIIVKISSKIFDFKTIFCAACLIVAMVIAYRRRKNKKSINVIEFYSNADASELSDEEFKLFNQRKEMLY